MTGSVRAQEPRLLGMAVRFWVDVVIEHVRCPIVPSGPRAVFVAWGSGGKVLCCYHRVRTSLTLLWPEVVRSEPTPVDAETGVARWERPVLARLTHPPLTSGCAMQCATAAALHSGPRLGDAVR
jgi:hypothetical protein